MEPPRNLTVRDVPVAATAVAASRANAPDKVTNEPSATQRSLNSRRLSNLVSLLFMTRFLQLRARSEDRSAEFHSASSPRRLKTPAAESRYGGMSGSGRYCCKSPKRGSGRFSAEERNKRHSPINSFT